MNREEAKSILESFRPGGADAANPQFAEALGLVERDAELRAWFQEQRAFDSAIAENLKDLAVPADLKASILAGRAVVRMPLWRDSRMRVAAAAAVALMVALAGAKYVGSGASFAEFREKLIVEAWAGDRHVDFESSEWKEVSRWLAAQNVSTNFNLPPALANVRLHGASVVDLDGHRISCVCLADGPKHLHLFVVTGAEFSDRSRDGTPDFEKCSGWKTASWQQGDKIFVLTGMKYQTFVSKFRKAGRWTMSG
jgi:hypothetical protein